MLEKNKAISSLGGETAVLVGIITRDQGETKVREYLDELAFLAETAGAKTKKIFTQKLERPDIRTFIGGGKLSEIKAFIHQEKVDLLIFDDELSGSQIRNIEKGIKGEDESFRPRVIDRTNLILDIFAKRARTAQSKTQVELAQYKYLLPRLTRMWTHLEKQRGGIGLRGPGETEIETDRRLIRDKISKLSEKLKVIERQAETQRKQRAGMVRVALVGYTNVGKSTILNLLAKTDVFAENKLFATLDTTTRKIVLENIPFLLSDTVGFIRKLPHDLVESFKSTLDEVREADILLHVADVSHPGFEEQVDVVNQTLVEIKASDKPTLLVLNKMDLYVNSETPDFTREEGETGMDVLRKTWMAKTNSRCILLSAAKRHHVQEFKALLMEEVKQVYFARYPNEKKKFI